MSSQAPTMYEELQVWRIAIDRMMAMAIEMESSEQDNQYVDDSIRELWKWFADEMEEYRIDFAHPDHPGKLLVFEFKCFAEDDDEEEVEDG